MIEGHYNKILNDFNLLDENKKQIAEKRYAICEECPFNSYNAELKGFYSTNREELHCSICLCPIEEKVMSMEEVCAITKLNNNNYNPLW